jgi:hypothetical protein
MIRLAEEFFETKNDPEQLDVNQEVMEQLERIHPATLSEDVEGDGPVVWILLIPATSQSMESFLSGNISETQLLHESNTGGIYDTIYLCSALVLPEFRQQGRAHRIACEAIAAIRQDHPIRTLFTWPFSQEGSRLAEKIAGTSGLTLRKRY